MFIHPPERGSFLSHDGNRANNVNGMARAMAKPSMPMAGPRLLPWLAASTSSVPMMGPVHENDTMTSVKAMKNRLSRPVVRSAAASTRFDHESGNLSSKAPKNEMANSTNNRKKMMLHTALVAKALSALAPKMALTARPSAT